MERTEDISPTENAKPPKDSPSYAETIDCLASDANPNQENFLGSSLGRFLLDWSLGEGAFGKVYRARDPILNRIVALKVAKRERLVSDEAIERFRREARSAAVLQHPNIVAVYDCGEEQGQFYIASTFVGGQSLDRLLRAYENNNSKAPIRESVLIVRKVAEALAYAHRSGIIHRDIKPANVMIRDDAEPMVMDFGLAARGDEARITQAGQLMGTPAYMAPEQWQTQATAASDQYSLGIMLYEMLTGQLPFVGDTVMLALRHSEMTPPSLRKIRKELPLDLETICLKTLEKSPERRYANCQELADDLRRWLDGEPVSARRASVVERATKWARRNPAIASLTLAVALLLILGTTISTTLALWAIQAEGRTQEQLLATREAKEQLQIEKEEADKARTSAQARYRLASAAFNDMVTVIQDRLGNVPGTQEARKELLTKARSGLLELLAETQKQPDTDATLLLAYMRIGDVEMTLGETKAAFASFQEAYTLAKAQLDAAPEDIEALSQLALCYQKLGQGAQQLGKPGQSLKYHQQSTEIREKLLKLAPNTQHQQAELAISYNLLAEEMRKLGRPDEAMAWLMKSLKIREQLLQANPTNSGALRNLAISCNMIGSLCLQQRKLDEALQWHTKSFDLRKRLAQSAPDDRLFQRDLYIANIELASVLGALGRAQEAIEPCKEAVNITKKLSADDPKNKQAQRDVALALQRLAVATQAVGSVEAAYALQKEALPIFKQIADTDRANAYSQHDLVTTYRYLAQIDQNRMEIADAIESLEQAMVVLKRFERPKDLVTLTTQIETDLSKAKTVQKLISSDDAVFSQRAQFLPPLVQGRVLQLLREKKLDEAQKTIERFVDWIAKQETNRNEHRLRAAALFVRCAKVADTPQTKDPLIQKSLDLLKQAADDGSFDAEKRRNLQSDPRFELLRELPQFKALVEGTK
jgi:tetratricopeptide (TPR) repeat protein